MNALTNTLRSVGPLRLAIIGGLGILMLGFVLYASYGTRGSMATLYADLDPRDAGAIGQRLDQLQIPYTVQPDGRRISVAEGEVGRARMALAAAGLPSGGTVGYELFNQPEGFGTSTFQQNINQLRALEGELSRTIQTLQPIRSARVHLVLPRRELFSRDRMTATASVFLRLRTGQQLSREQVGAIQHLVAAAVPQLDPGRISIVDERGNLLARGTGSESADAVLTAAQERRVAIEQRLSQQIEDFLSRSVGYGRVRAQVSADLDLDRISTRSETFDPDATAPRSTQTVTEQSEATERDGLDAVTVQNQLPQNQTETAGVGTRNRNSRNEETTNFEISRTTRDQVREPGGVRRLSVAVLVDGTYAPGPDGRPQYTPRTADELNQLTALARTAIGFDPIRGDSIELVNMQFAVPDDQLGPVNDGLIWGIPRADLFSVIEMTILAVVLVLVILLVVRPLISRLFDERAVQAEEANADALAHQMAMGALPPPLGGGADAMEGLEEDSEIQQMIDINRVEGRVRASTVKKVGEIVERHPEEAVSIIRSWVYQEI